MGHFGIPCGAHGGPWGLPVTPVGPMWTPLYPSGPNWVPLDPFGSSWWVQVAPFRSLLAPFGRILVTFVEGLGDFLEAFPRQMEICTYVLEFFLSLFPFSALPVPLLRQVFWDLLKHRQLSQIHRFHLK